MLTELIRAALSFDPFTSGAAGASQPRNVQQREMARRESGSYAGLDTPTYVRRGLRIDALGTQRPR